MLFQNLLFLISVRKIYIENAKVDNCPPKGNFPLTNQNLKKNNSTELFPGKTRFERFQNCVLDFDLFISILYYTDEALQELLLICVCLTIIPLIDPWWQWSK